MSLAKAGLAPLNWTGHYRGMNHETAGGSGRAAPQHATVAPATVSAIVSISTGLKIGYVPGWEASTTEAERAAAILDVRGRWEPQWWALLRSRDILKSCYAGQSMSNVWAVHAVEVGCLASQWLEEHLAKLGHGYGYPHHDLTDANDLANTHKHAGRKADKYRVGRVLDFAVGPAGEVSIRITFARPGEEAVQLRDALELLEGCVAAWHSHLVVTFGAEPPPPPEG